MTRRSYSTLGRPCQHPFPHRHTFLATQGEGQVEGGGARQGTKERKGKERKGKMVKKREYFALLEFHNSFVSSFLH